jgi:hypothetical protein
VRVHANPDRVEKPGLRALAAHLDDLEATLAELPGYGTR